MVRRITLENITLGLTALVVLAAAGLYLFTLDNGLRPDELTGGDLITHQYAQVEARPSNAPGYPLYTMGGWLWFRLGRFGLSWLLNPIQILSLYSTIWGLASLLLLALILRRVSPRPGWLAPLLTAFYATTFFFWYYSVTTEQYTSAIFQTLLLIWLALRWDEVPADSTLGWLALVSGTMVANMVTTLLLLPPLLWFILTKRTAAAPARPELVRYLKQPGLILPLAGLALLPLLSYGYIYLRGAQHPEWRGAGQWPTTWAWFIDFLTIQQGRDELAPGLSLANLATAEFPALMWQELTWPIFGGGLIGLAWLGRRRAIFLYGSLVIYCLFAWSYRFGNWFQVILPAYPIFIIGVAAGLGALLSGKKRYRPWLSQGLTLLLLGLLLYRFNLSLPRANQRDLPGDTGLAPGWAIVADQPASPALISTSFAEQVALQYLRVIWQAAPGIYPTSPGDFTPPPALASATPHLYISRQALAAAPDSLRKAGRPQAAGVQLIGLTDSSALELSDSNPVRLDLKFGDSLRLIGWELGQPPRLPGYEPATNWQIALYWQSAGPLAVDYTISVRPLAGGQVLTNPAGEAMIQDHQPVWDSYPTSRWPPAEIVRDVYALKLPAETTPEAMQIVVYQATASGFSNLADHIIELKGGP
jgi:hypothetical protein